MAKTPKNSSVSIIIPVFNEGINLKYMIRIIEATTDVPHELLLVYDFPSDNSVPVIKSFQKTYPNIKPVYNQKGRGVINAIRSGVEIAKNEYILILTADDLGPVLTVEKMRDLMDQGCDVVSATRYAYGGRVLGGHILSKLFSRSINKLSHLLGVSAMTDSTVGLKMFKKSVFNKIRFECAPVGWVWAYEFAIKVQEMKFRIGEVPIISINRFYGGKSSFNAGKWGPHYAKWFFYALNRRFIKGTLRPREIAVLK